MKQISANEILRRHNLPPVDDIPIIPKAKEYFNKLCTPEQAVRIASFFLKLPHQDYVDLIKKLEAEEEA